MTKSTRIVSLVLTLALCAGCPATCPPKQITYSRTHATGMVCASCLGGDKCDPVLYPAEQVDAAISIVAKLAVEHGIVSADFGASAPPRVWVCLVDHLFALHPPAPWGFGRCTEATPPRHCLAGQSASEVVKVATAGISGEPLKVHESALVHELWHSFGVGHDRDALLYRLIDEVNAELKRMYP